MKVKRKHHGAVEKRSSEQQFRSFNTIMFVVWKIWSHTTSATKSFDRLAGSQADETLLNLEIFRITYWTKYWNFTTSSSSLSGNSELLLVPVCMLNLPVVGGLFAKIIWLCWWWIAWLWLSLPALLTFEQTPTWIGKITLP